ncbi:agmatine deiminase family protein [Streptomyces sp. ODS28]|uniref:agmatine deiminase family protein n=1 Tax=Streptomyces sp. ODS28 TaxID=3136688 RepID=UPI0031ED5671
MRDVSARDGGGEGGPARPRLPAGWQPHARTFLAWPPRWSVWGRYARGAQHDIGALARAIAEYEPVVVLARPGEVRAARRGCGGAAEVWPVPVDDLWVRDTGPVFVAGGGPAVAGGSAGQGALYGIDLGFNGWGGSQRHRRDRRVARRVLERAGVPRVRPGLTAEGGSLETDGEGTLLATESSLLDPARNPGMTRGDVERELKDAFGADTVVWLRGVRGEDITDCHVDALARFAAPGVVLLSRPARGGDVWERVYEQARAALREATDARGRRLELVELPEADPRGTGDRGPDFLGSYVNYYVANGAVLLPRFGDRRADERAASLLGDLHPGREIRAVTVDTVASGGGGIHCATQQQPEARQPEG